MTRENCAPSTSVGGASGGGGIRTHGGLATTTVFETVRFVRSRTPPGRVTWNFTLAVSRPVLTSDPWRDGPPDMMRVDVFTELRRRYGGTKG
jgi:hypothetical protein